MTQKSELGAAGEEAAAKYLESHKYKILDRNYRKSWGEIDLITLAPDKTLVFVEVKTVSGSDPWITAEEQVTGSKLNKVKRTCSLYANEHEELSKRGWRIDVLAINLVGKDWRVKHYENVS